MAINEVEKYENSFLKNNHKHIKNLEAFNNWDGRIS